MDKKNMTYELRIKAIIDEAQKNLGTFEKQLKTTWENGAPPKHMSKSLEGIRARLASLQEVAKKGIVDSSDLAMAESDYKAFSKTIHDLSIEFKLFTAEQKKAMLSEEEQRAMANRTAAVKAYNEELKRNREILEKRKNLETEKEATKAKQQPARLAAETKLTDYGTRKEKLSKNGPVLSPAAKGYVAALEEQSKLLDEIKTKQTAIENLKKAGRRTDRDNSLTRTIKELEELEAKYKKFDSVAGKSEYDAAMAKYAEQVAEVDQVIEETKNEIAAMDGELNNFDKKLDKLSIPNTKQALADLKKELKDLGVEGIEDAESIEEIEKAIEKLNGKALQRVDDNLEKARKELEQLGEQGKKAQKGLDQATQAIKEQEETVRQQEAFEGKIKQFLGMAGAAQVMRNALRNAMSTIKDLDATMTEMAVVTDLEIGDYWKQLDEHAARASSLGASINDVYKAETLYYQQGLKTEEVVALSTETIKMATIAGLDSADATNKMTAALRGFNMELNETSAQRVADVYSELAAITAADVDEISSAMTKTASIAASAGMEFETTAAFLSQIIETTRESAETAGTAMKTVIARFQELKKDPAEIGEVDGEIVDANKIETALRSVGVALRDANGQFRDLDDVFLELASKWDSLDTNTQRYIATIAAGSRQQSRFIAMMSDYERTQSLVTAANNSAGASNKQFEKTVDSISHKLAALKTAWEEFSMGILESDLVKFGVEALTKFLEIINKATSGFEGLGGSITKVLTIIGLFKVGQKIFEKFKNPLTEFFINLTKMGYEAGYKTAKAYMEGGEKAKQEMQEGTTEETQESAKEDSSSPISKTKDKTGITSILKGKNELSELSKLKKSFVKKTPEELEQMQQLAEKKKKHGWKKDGTESKANGAEKSRKEYRELNDEIEQYKKNEQALKAGSKAAWKEISQGISQAGQAVTGLGIGISMVGGLLSSMGLEEAGKTITNIGNAITFVGSALMAIPPILTMISSHPIVAAIVGAIAIITISVVSLISFFEKNKPEKKLQRIADAVEQAGKGAEVATKAYENLNDSLDSLRDQYKNLEELRYGTEEWSKAVQNVNASVLELIDEYPELASLIESKEGVLTLDIDSAEAQEIIAKYKQSMVEAKGVEYGAKIQHSQAKADYKLDIIDDKVFEEFITDGKIAAQGEAMANLFLTTLDRGIQGVLIGGGVGALIGAVGGALGSEVVMEVAQKVLYSVYGIGAVIEAVDAAAGPVDEVIVSGTSGALTALGTGTLGAGIGGAIGTIAGLIEGIIEYQPTVDMVEKRNQQNRDNVSILSKAYAEGEVGASKEEIIKFIERENIATGKAAEKMAETFLENEEILRDYGQALSQTEAEQKAYYQAMATNAQQMINLAAYTQQQLDWMTNVVDEDLVKAYEEKAKKELEELDKDELKLAKQNYVTRIYGENARIEDNKILDEKGETLREFVDDEDWLNEMASANAVIESANAMAQIPDILNKSIKTFDTKLQSSVSKAFTGQDLTQEELNNFEKAIGEITYKDEEGNIAKDFNELTKKQQELWGTRDNYEASLDRDFSGINAAWERLSDKQKKAFGWDGTEETLEQAKEAYEATYTEIYDTQIEQFRKAKRQAKELNLGELSENLTSEAAQGWVNGLTALSFNESDLAGLNESLSAILTGLTTEQTNAVMAQVNAIDKMDIQAWKDLALTFEELGISIPEKELQAFINKGIEVSGAIEKIDFSGLSQKIYSLYDLVDKIENGGRQFSQEDYSSLIATDSSLKDQFIQMGDEFVYIGNSLANLTDAIKENTTATLQEANRQLGSHAGMSKLIAKESINYGSIEAMDAEQLQKYMTNMRASIAEQGYDIADFGIQGLNNQTDIEQADINQLRAWATALSQEGTKKDLYAKDYAAAISQANIQRYIHNDASFNAKQAAEKDEYSDEHQQALIIQAVQSGAVGESIIADYRAAIESQDSREIARIGDIIAKSINTKIEDSKDRQEYESIVQRLTDALYNTSQKQIDKLSTVNDSINDAKSQLVSKIQDQINANRQARENNETKTDISNLESKRAMLGMQTDGSSALAQQQLDVEIEQAKQDYQDSLVDQALQNISDANEKAAEQRERQISLMQAQLDYARDSGMLANEAARIAKTSSDDIRNGVLPLETAMGRLLWESEGGGLGALEKERWVSDLTSSSVAMGKYFSAKEASEKASERGGNVTGVETASTSGETESGANIPSFDETPIIGQLETVKGSFAKFFTVDIPNWWNNSVVPFFTTSIPTFFEGIKQSFADFFEVDIPTWFDSFKRMIVNFFTVEIPRWWNTYIAPYFTEEYWVNQMDSLGYALTVFLFETLPQFLLNCENEWRTFWEVTVPTILSNFIDGSLVKINEWITSVKIWWGQLSEDVKKLDESVRQVFRNIEAWGQSTNQKILGWLSGILEWGQSLGEFISDLIGNIWKTVSPYFEKLGEIWDALLDFDWNRLSKLLSDIGAEFSYMGKLIGYYFSAGFSTGWNALATTANSTISGIGSFLAKVFDGFIGGVKRALDGINTSALEKIWPDGKNFISTIKGISIDTNVNLTPLKLLPVPSKPTAAFKTGGLADFTGPAWLDGTKSRPELVLNARDTQNFVQLKDILADIMNGSNDLNSKSSKTGDNYFDIEINVENIDSDYDVEQIANKIRSMIYEDATYRNVNAISFAR